MKTKDISKSKLARKIGISRPTLDKLIANNDERVQMHFDIASQKLAIKLSARHIEVSPKNIESILEFLSDHRFLNKEGVNFAHNYWDLFIKE